MARGKGRSGRRYVRDAKGRFASKGFSGQTGGRGARLKAAGKKREGGGEKVKVSGAKSSGIIRRSNKKTAAAKSPQVSSARQAATDRLKIKTQTRRAIRADRASVITPGQRSRLETGKGATMKSARPKATVAKPRTKGNDPRTVARRVDRKAAVNQANIKNIIRAERTGATQGRQYQRALKTQTTLTRAQEFTKTGKLPGRDNSIKAQRERKAASQRLMAKNAERKAAKGRRQRTVSTDKVERIAERLNKVATTKGGREGIKALNRTEVAVRAKSFLSRKAGGVSGLNSMGDKAAKLKSVKSSIDTRRKYSTQKSNRNKPGKFNDLGQSKLRAQNKAAQAKPASVNLGKPAQVTSRGRTIKPAENFKPAVKGKSAPDNARTRANKLKTAQNKVRMYSETDSRSAQNAIANRNAALKARPQGTPGKVVFRSKNRASSRFQQRANDLTSRIKGDLKSSKPGTFSATGGGGGRGIVRRNTGDKQTSMFGKPAPLYTNKTAKSVKRRSGKRK